MEVKVDSAELKDFFISAKSILKGKEDSKVIFFRLEGGYLELAIHSGVSYRKLIPVASKDSTSIACTYKDLSDLIGTKGLSIVSLHPTYVGIETDSFSLSLIQAYSSFISYVSLEGDYSRVNKAGITSAVKRLGQTKPLAKVFGRDAAVIFTGERAIVKYPTIWVSVEEDSFNSILTMQDAEILSDFQPDEMRSTDRVMEFRRGNSCLSIVRTPVGQEDDFVLSSDVKGTIDTTDLLSVVQKVLPCVGPIDGTIHLYEGGQSLSVSAPDMSVSITSGDCSVPVMYVPMPLEYLRMFCRIVGGYRLNVRREGHKLCLTTSTTTILVSVMP